MKLEDRKHSGNVSVNTIAKRDRIWAYNKLTDEQVNTTGHWDLDDGRVYCQREDNYEDIILDPAEWVIFVQVPYLRN